MIGAAVLIAAVFAAAFILSVLTGSPYVRTHKKPLIAAFELLNLKPGEKLVDLGCGDGAVLLEAARRGLRAEGWEINPFLWAVCHWRIRKFKGAAKVHLGNMWRARLPADTKAVFIFLDARFLPRFDKKMRSARAKAAVVSYAYRIPNKKIIKSRQGMHLYRY